MGPYTREKVENWVGDFCAGDEVREFSSGVREYAGEILTTLMVGACEKRGVEPEEVEEADLKHALLGAVARLGVPGSIRAEIPALCGGFLAQLEAEGRVGGGRMLGAYVRALKMGFEEATPGKGKTITRPGSKIGRNDPCPCGSGKKYKKCCMKA